MSKKTQKQEQHIEILEKSQQLKFRMPTEIRISKHNALYQASIQLEELDYTKLYRAYSGIRKSQIEPRVLFKVLVCAYMKGVYSSRKIEELCRENLVFRWLLEDQKTPDHCTIARFRGNRNLQEAFEDLFFQYVKKLENKGYAVGEIVNRFSNVQAINNIIINTFSQVAVQIITSTICLVTMFVYSPSLSVITIAIGTIELVLLLGINKKNREDTSKYIADQSNMQGLLAEAIGNIIEIRCMGMEKAIYKNLTNQFLDELESFRKKSNTGNQMLAISSTITLIFPLIIYILGYSSVVNEALTIGQLIAYVTLANYFISPFVSIVIALPNLNFVYEVFLRYKELITYRETHKNGVIGGQQFEELYLANVSFSYNHSLNQKVLNDISLHIRPQELCAIVGFSGSGKSTLLKIILGLLSPDVGTVKINSIKANDFSHDRMYEWFSVVTQNPMCLNSSVRKNVDVTESFSDDDIPVLQP